MGSDLPLLTPKHFSYFSELESPGTASSSDDDPKYVLFGDKPPLVQLKEPENNTEEEINPFLLFMTTEMKKLQTKVDEMPPGHYHVDYIHVASLFRSNNEFRNSFQFPGEDVSKIAQLYKSSQSRAYSAGVPIIPTYSSVTKLSSSSFSTLSTMRQHCSLMQLLSKSEQKESVVLPPITDFAKLTAPHFKHYLLDKPLPVQVLDNSIPVTATGNEDKDSATGSEDKDSATGSEDNDSATVSCHKPLLYSQALKENMRTPPPQRKPQNTSPPPIVPIFPSYYYQIKNWTGCRFCCKNNEPPAVYTSHNLHEPDTGKVTCPVLRRHTCELCGATGDGAHTRSHCPIMKRLCAGRSNISTTLAIKSTYRQSNGEARKPFRNLFPGN